MMWSGVEWRELQFMGGWTWTGNVLQGNVKPPHCVGMAELSVFFALHFSLVFVVDCWVVSSLEDMKIIVNVEHTCHLYLNEIFSSLCLMIFDECWKKIWLIFNKHFKTFEFEFWVVVFAHVFVVILLAF